MAKSYFEKMGFKCPPGGAVADFLTAVPVHTERMVRPGFDNMVPSTAEEFESRYYQSTIWQDVNKSMIDCTSLEHEVSGVMNTGAGQRKGILSRDNEQSVYSTSMIQQIRACTIR
jgi:ATP-binding cassette subfamily G (WHITE) protein 2 (SNQ2)